MIHRWLQTTFSRTFDAAIRQRTGLKLFLLVILILNGWIQHFILSHFGSKEWVAYSQFDYSNLHGFSTWRFRMRVCWPWSHAASLIINLLLNRNNLTNKDFVQVINVFRILNFLNLFNWEAIMFNSLCILNSTVDMGALNFKEIW